jgi:hypothetical protein
VQAESMRKKLPPLTRRGAGQNDQRVAVRGRFSAAADTRLAFGATFFRVRTPTAPLLSVAVDAALRRRIALFLPQQQQQIWRSPDSKTYVLQPLICFAKKDKTSRGLHIVSLPLAAGYEVSLRELLPVRRTIITDGHQIQIFRRCLKLCMYVYHSTGLSKLSAKLKRHHTRCMVYLKT